MQTDGVRVLQIAVNGQAPNRNLSLSRMFFRALVLAFWRGRSCRRRSAPRAPCLKTLSLFISVPSVPLPLRLGSALRSSGKISGRSRTGFGRLAVPPPGAKGAKRETTEGPRAAREPGLAISGAVCSAVVRAVLQPLEAQPSSARFVKRRVPAGRQDHSAAPVLRSDGTSEEGKQEIVFAAFRGSALPMTRMQVPCHWCMTVARLITTAPFVQGRRGTSKARRRAYWKPEARTGGLHTSAYFQEESFLHPRLWCSVQRDGGYSSRHWCHGLCQLRAERALQAQWAAGVIMQLQLMRSTADRRQTDR